MSCDRIDNKSKGDVTMNYSVLLVAAGKKAGDGESYRKALAKFKDSKSVLDQTVSVFLQDPNCKQIVLVSSSADMMTLVQSAATGKVVVVKGGKTRQESVQIGLAAVSEDVVLIHDGVRPWIYQELIDRLLVRMQTEKACILAIKPQTAVYEVENGYIRQALNPNAVVIAQTPQAFNTSFLIQCYRKAEMEGINYNDDASIVRSVSDVDIAIEQGDIRNTRFILKEK